MKKFFYLMACVAIAGFGFTSCGDDDDPTPGGGSSAGEVRAPKTEEFAAIYEIPETPVTLTTLDGKKTLKTLKEIEVTEDEHIIFTLKELPALEAPTRADDEESWRMYKFTKDGDSYKVVGFGTIIIVKDGEGYLIELRPNEGETAKTTGKYKRSTRDALTKKLCLTWTIDSYRVLVTSKGSTVGTNWKSLAGGGCDFQELIDYANEEHNAGIKADLGKKQIVEGITFTGQGTFLINYKNTDEQDVGNWKWETTENNASGTLNYLWRNPNKMGNDFLGDLGGTAKIKFDGEYCRLTLIGQVDRKSEVSIDFKLK